MSHPAFGAYSCASVIHGRYEDGVIISTWYHASKATSKFIRKCWRRSCNALAIHWLTRWHMIILICITCVAYVMYLAEVTALHCLSTLETWPGRADCNVQSPVHRWFLYSCGRRCTRKLFPWSVFTCFLTSIFPETPLKGISVQARLCNIIRPRLVSFEYRWWDSSKRTRFRWWVRSCL